jgi:hypothetical protein
VSQQDAFLFAGYVFHLVDRDKHDCWPDAADQDFELVGTIEAGEEAHSLDGSNRANGTVDKKPLAVREPVIPAGRRLRSYDPRRPHLPLFPTLIRGRGAPAPGRFGCQPLLKLGDANRLLPQRVLDPR